MKWGHFPPCCEPWLCVTWAGVEAAGQSLPPSALMCGSVNPRLPLANSSECPIWPRSPPIAQVLTALGDLSCSPHHAGEETEAQRGVMTCPKSQMELGHFVLMSFCWLDLTLSLRGCCGPRGALSRRELWDSWTEWLRHPHISWGRWGAARSLRLGDREPVRGLRGLEGGRVPRCSQTPPFLCLVAMRVSPCEVREE